MNCIVYVKETKQIIFYIKDCVIKDNSILVGSNMKIHGINLNKFSLLFTEENIKVINNDDNVITLSKPLDKINPAPIFEGIFVGSREEVNKIIKKKIREQYSLEDELKILRMKLSGTSNGFTKYRTFIEDLIQQGQDFKDTYFPADNARGPKAQK